MPSPPPAAHCGIPTPPPPEVLQQVPAGNIGDWMVQMTGVLRGHADSIVPCGTCVGCCSSHWPVALRDTDAAAAAAVDPAHVASPRGTAHGLRYLLPLPDGRCPMLQKNGCHIYSVRPQTCRDFDCRLFAAVGIPSAGADKPLINERIRAWQFRYDKPGDAALHQALLAAGRFLQRTQSSPDRPALPKSPIATAVLAFKAHTVFLDGAHAHLSDADLWPAVLAAIQRFDEASAGNAVVSEPA